MVASIARLVERSPRAVVLVFALVAVAALVLASRLRMEPGLDYLLVQEDPEHERNHQIKVEFSNDELLIVGLELDRPFELQDLRRLRRLSEEIAQLEGVEEVIDVTTVEDVRSDADGFLDTSPLLDSGDLETQDPAEEARILAIARDRLRGHRLFDGNLVSHDGTALAIVIVPKLVDGRPSGRVNLEVVRATSALLRKYDFQAWLGGYPAAEEDSNRIALKDLIVLTGGAILLIFLLVILLHRHWSAVLFVAVIAGLSELVAMAWLELIGAPLTPVTAILPSILLATSSAYGIYLFGFLRQVPRDEKPGPALVSLAARPCAVAAIATGLGFLALELMPVAALRSLGSGLAVGIAACWAGSLLLVPALVQVLGIRAPAPRATADGLSRLATLGVDMARRPVPVLLATGAVLAISLLGLLRIEIESDPITYWRPESYHRRSDDFLRRQFDGSLFINVVLSTGQPDGALAPEVLRFAQKLLAEAQGTGTVTRTISILDYLALIDDAMNPEGRGLPDQARAYLSSESLAAQYMLLYENSGDPQNYEHYINFDRSGLNLFLKVSSRSSREILGLRDRLYAFAASEQAARPADLRVEVLGTWLLFPKAMDGIARNMVRGLLLTSELILLLLMMALRSPRLGLISVVPNLLPILVCLGCMGWFGIPISFATSITGCIALGLAVDDTAHVVGHLREGASLREAYRTVGRPLIDTTLAVGIGFLAIGLSEFQPVAYLGYATALTLVVALLADLILLPSLLVVFGWPLEEPQVEADDEPESRLVEAS